LVKIKGKLFLVALKISEDGINAIAKINSERGRYLSQK
jgi:hypothetical protein